MFFIVKVHALNFKAPLGKKIIKADIPGVRKIRQF